MQVAIEFGLLGEKGICNVEEGIKDKGLEGNDVLPELTASLGGGACGGPGGCSVGLLHSTAHVLSERGLLRRRVRHCCTPVGTTKG